MSSVNSQPAREMGSFNMKQFLLFFLLRRKTSSKKQNSISLSVTRSLWPVVCSDHLLSWTLSVFVVVLLFRRVIFGWLLETRSKLSFAMAAAETARQQAVVGRSGLRLDSESVWEPGCCIRGGSNLKESKNASSSLS